MKPQLSAHPLLTCVPEAFHARFPVSVKSLKQLTQPAADEVPRRTQEKTSAVPRVADTKPGP